MLENRITAVEADIGRLMQRRVDDSAGPIRELELRIDVRIVARWMFAQAAAAPAGSDRQTAGWIRGNDLLAAAVLAEHEIDANARSVPPNAPAVRALHDLTFKLGDAKAVADLDAASQAAGSALLVVFGGDAGAARLPAMRPPAEQSTDPSSAANAPRSVEQLAARIRSLNVSGPLRAQLLATSGAAAALARDPQKAGEADAIRAVLDEAVTLAEGLQGNTAVERDDRVQMEAQVGQGLAMFLDPRTRPLGKKHVAALGQYRQMLVKLGDMRIAPELMKRFTPALLAARRNPESGGQVMESIEVFLRQDARLAALPAGGGELTGPFAKAADEAKRRATAAREAFVDAAGSTSSPRNPQVLRGRADAVRKALDGHAAITRTPETMKALNGYRPKPFGGLDKRVQAALNAWTNDDDLDRDREAATQFLTQLGRLADHASELSRPATAPAAGADVIAAYTGGRLDSFHARRKALVSEVINATAAGRPLDDAALAPLETARTLLGALDLAARAELALAEADVLQRWVDWGVDRAPLGALLDPFREATSGAFEGYVNSDARLLNEWSAQWKRYEPILALLARVAGRAEACRTLPPGRTGALAKLVTPLADQPYAAERSARLSLDTWFHHHETKNPKQADTALDALATRLRR